MRAECVVKVEAAIGRPLAQGEAGFIDQQISAQLREDFRNHPTKARALNRTQRLRVAGVRAAQKIARGQAVVEWTKQDQDTLQKYIREEVIKAGANVTVEITSAIDSRARWFPSRDVIAFALDTIDGKSVDQAMKSMHGVISHELVHWAWTMGIIDDAHWAELVAAIGVLHFRKSDATRHGLLDEWKAASAKKKNPTYLDVIKNIYKGDGDTAETQLQEAVAAAIEVEAGRSAAEMASQGPVIRRALGALIRMGRVIAKAFHRLAAPQQAALREMMVRSEKALRSGAMAREQYQQTKIELPIESQKITEISDEVLERIPREEIDDLIERLERTVIVDGREILAAQPAEIMDAPFFETIKTIEGPPSINSAQAAAILNSKDRVEQIDKLKAAFSSFAGPKGPKIARRAVVLTGAPGAGKTTIAGRIARSTRSAYLSADLANETLFSGGINSNSTYAEAKALTDLRAGRDLIVEGNNVVIERYGEDVYAVKDQIAILRHMGYSVDVVHVRSDFATRVRGAAIRALATGRWVDASEQLRVGNGPTNVHKTVNRLGMANGAFEVRLNARGKYVVTGRSGKPSPQLSRAVTAAAGGGLARAAQALVGARTTEPRNYALEYAKLFRANQKRWGVERDHQPMDNFAGRKAKGANLTKLGQAQRLDKKGVDREELKRLTGWFYTIDRGRSNKKHWQYILPSGKITLKPELLEFLANSNKNSKFRGKLEDLIDTPVLDDYPALKSTNTIVDLSMTGASVGALGTVTIGATLLGTTTEQLFAHEIQHLISDIEKFERGGSPLAIALSKRSLNRAAPQWAIDHYKTNRTYNPTNPIDRSYALYIALTDELRARSAELMESMTEAERKSFRPPEPITKGFSDKELIGIGIDSIPLKFFVKWSIVWGGGVYGGIALVNFLSSYFSTNGVNPDSVGRLEGVLAEGKQIEQPSETPQEFRLKKAQSMRFLDFSEKWKPVQRAFEAVGVERAPTSFTREQYSRLGRALFDVTDLSFMEDMPEKLPRRDAFLKSNKMFQAFEVDRKSFALFLENGVMDGGFVVGANKRRVIDGVAGSTSKNKPIKIIVNPTASDLYTLTRPIRGEDKTKFSSIRYIRDNVGNVFVTNAWGAIHDDIHDAAVNAGYKVTGYQRGAMLNEDHGPEVTTGTLNRAGNSFKIVAGSGDLSFEDVFPHLRQQQSMDARGRIRLPSGAIRTYRAGRAYHSPGGRRGAATSSTVYRHIPPQPGFEDIIADIQRQMSMTRTKRFLGETIQDKGPNNTYKLLFGALKGLDQLDHDMEQWLKAKWGRLFNTLPIVRNIINTYFPFGGVPDSVMLMALRNVATGRVSKAADLATRRAGDLKKEAGDYAMRTLGINVVEAKTIKNREFEEAVANVIENVRVAMVEENGVLQLGYLNALPQGVQQATVDAIETLDEIGDALVEGHILHESQRAKHAGHYLRRAYMKYLSSYSPSAGMRASGAHYGKLRDVLPEDVLATKGEIKYTPFLVYLSIEEPLRDLAMYGYLSSLMHYDANAPISPKWFLPNTTVMWGGQFRTLFWLASQERVDAERSLGMKTSELSAIGGMRANSPQAQELRREMRILQTTLNAIDALIAHNPKFASAVSRGDLPDGYRQLPTNTGRYGDAAGAIVLTKIYNDITAGGDVGSKSANDIEAGAKHAWEVFNRNQKFLLTVANPATHFRNIYSNVMMLVRSGANAVEVISAVGEVWDHYQNGNTSAGVQALLDGGLIEQSLPAAEMRQLGKFSARVQRMAGRAKIRERVEGVTGPGSGANAILSALDVAGAITFGSKNVYAEAASFMYQMEDTVFKLAKINDELKRNSQPFMAVAEARKHFFDYTSVPNLVRWLREGPIAPFISFSYFATPNALEGLGTAPWRISYAPYMEFILFAALFAAMAGYDADDGWEAMSEGQRERYLIPIPMRDSNGRTVWFDGIYLLPEGAMVGAALAAFRGDWYGAGRAYGVVGGPIVNAGIGVVSGVDVFRGTRVWEETDADSVRNQKNVAFVARTFTPSTYNYYIPPLPGEIVGGPGYEAVFGTGVDRNGEPVPDDAMRWARIFGLNVYPQDLNYELMKRNREFNYRVNNIQMEVRRLQRNQQLTPERRLEAIEAKQEEIQQLLDARDRMASRTLNASMIESQLESQRETR